MFMPLLREPVMREAVSQCRPTVRGVARLLPILCVLVAGGCAANALIRSEAVPCRQGAPDRHDPPCSRNMVEMRSWPGADRAGRPVAVGYTLDFVEFDDEGKMFSPEQQRRLFDGLARNARTQDLSIIVFVHGWKHNARADDTNVEDFRRLLAAIARSESDKEPRHRRKVVGVYVAWRGASLELPFADNLSFWARKDAAHRVAEGAIRGLLGKLRAFRDTIDEQPGLPGSRQPTRTTRMLTIGHSFGGLIVYSALAQYFIDRAAIASIHADYFPRAAALDHKAEKADPREISSYGDLVVLVNPAIEAMRYEPLRQLVQEQADGNSRLRYAPCQSPVLVQVTSVGGTLLQGDWATGIAFPAGRAIDTMLEATRGNERAQILKSVGHYKAYWTHDLQRMGAGREPGKVERATLMRLNTAEQDRSFRSFERSRLDGYLRSGWQRTYGADAVLTETAGDRADPNNPFWVVRAHPDIILDHNDILAPVFVNFVAQLYADIDRLKAAPECARVAP